MRTYIHKPDSPAYGTPMQCPNCNAHGHYDDMIGGDAEFRNSIWFSSGQWNCKSCCSDGDR